MSDGVDDLIRDVMSDEVSFQREQAKAAVRESLTGAPEDRSWVHDRAPGLFGGTAPKSPGVPVPESVRHESRAFEVMDRQGEFVEWWDSDHGRQYAAYFARSILSQSDNPEWRKLWTDGGIVHQTVSALARGATPLWVSEDMFEVLKGAAPSITPHPFLPEDLPERTGFVLFPRPMKIAGPPSDPTPIHFRAALWGVLDYKGPLFEATGTDQQLAVGLLASADDLEWSDYEMLQVRSKLGGSLPPLTFFHWITWRFGKQYESEADTGSADALMVMQALFALVRQRVGVLEPQRNRAAERRFSRAAKPEVVPIVKVIVLRRRELKATFRDPDADPEMVEWSHRWVVDGHWRNQWYPSENRHRSIWISPYIKGPDDKPLVLKKTVYAWTR